MPTRGRACRTSRTRTGGTQFPAPAAALRRRARSEITTWSYRRGASRAVYGLSTQDTAYQREAADRLHLPFALLSDERLMLTSAMRLPSFKVGSMVLLKRLTLIIRDGVVEHLFYPVFPPDRNVDEVLKWLAEASGQSP